LEIGEARREAMANSVQNSQGKKYTARAILIVNFGENNPYADESITKGVIKFTYNDISHTDCLQMAKRTGNVIEKIRAQIAHIYNCDDKEVTSHLQQLRFFYDYFPSEMFITIFQNKLWFCYGTDTIVVNEDNTKERGTVEGWKNININGEPLSISDFPENITFEEYKKEIGVLKDNRLV
jgi:hypothetical protein